MLTSIKLGVKIKKRKIIKIASVYEQFSHFLIAITGSKSAIFQSS